MPQHKNKSACVGFPAERINNKSFCCLAEAAVGVRPDEECIFDWFQILKGLEVKSLSNSADYCGALGLY